MWFGRYYLAWKLGQLEVGSDVCLSGEGPHWLDGVGSSIPEAMMMDPRAAPSKTQPGIGPCAVSPFSSLQVFPISSLGTMPWCIRFRPEGSSTPTPPPELTFFLGSADTSHVPRKFRLSFSPMPFDCNPATTASTSSSNFVMIFLLQLRRTSYFGPLIGLHVLSTFAFRTTCFKAAAVSVFFSFEGKGYFQVKKALNLNSN